MTFWAEATPSYDLLQLLRDIERAFTWRTSLFVHIHVATPTHTPTEKVNLVSPSHPQAENLIPACFHALRRAEGVPSTSSYAPSASPLPPGWMDGAEPPTIPSPAAPGDVQLLCSLGQDGGE